MYVQCEKACGVLRLSSVQSKLLLYLTYDPVTYLVRGEGGGGALGGVGGGVDNER
jgi:hypothetical protein